MGQLRQRGRRLDQPASLLGGKHLAHEAHHRLLALRLACGKLSDQSRQLPHSLRRGQCARMLQQRGLNQGQALGPADDLTAIAIHVEAAADPMLQSLDANACAAGKLHLASAGSGHRAKQ